MKFEQALRHGFERVGLTWPASDRAKVDAIKWDFHLNRENGDGDDEINTLRMCYMQFVSQFHDPRHRPTCFKKNAILCRFHIPYNPHIEPTEVSFDGDDRLIISLQRMPWDAYIALHYDAVGQIFGSNNNVKLVENCLLAYYLAAYQAKISRENADNLAAAVSGVVKCIKNRSERAASKLIAAAASFGASTNTEDNTNEEETAAESTDPSTNNDENVIEDEQQFSGSQQAMFARAGLGNLSSAIFHNTKSQVIAAQLASFLLLGNSTFVFSHDFCTLPVQQGIAYINNEPIHAIVSHKYGLRSSVLDYVYRPTELEDMYWYLFIRCYTLALRPAEIDDDMEVMTIYISLCSCINFI